MLYVYASISTLFEGNETKPLWRVMFHIDNVTHVDFLKVVSRVTQPGSRGFFHMCFSVCDTCFWSCHDIISRYVTCGISKVVSFLWLCVMLFLGFSHVCCSLGGVTVIFLGFVTCFSGYATCVVSQVVSPVLFLRMHHVCCFSGSDTCVVSQVASWLLFPRVRHIFCCSDFVTCVVSQVVAHVFCFSYYDTCIVLQVASYVLCFSGCDTCFFFVVVAHVCCF